MPPFVVFAMPRSRSFWLSRFLTAGGIHCGHDELRRCRSLDDVRSWLAQPLTGTVETAAAPFWRLLAELRPGTRVAVLRRPVAEVVDSLARFGFDPVGMRAAMQRLDAKLGQIAARVPGALSVTAAELDDEAACARVFEHCTGLPHDPAWWRTIAPLNLQTDMRAAVRYAGTHAAQLQRLRSVARHKSLAQLAGRVPALADGLTIAEEPVEAYIRDAAALRDDHYVAVGEAPYYHLGLNYPELRRMEQLGALQTVMARSNGRVFGYLVTILSPSLDDATVLSSLHTTFYASPLFPGLGRKIVRAANARLQAKGVGEILSRAGTRGDGPRLGALWQRLGAEDCGQLYRLTPGKDGSWAS
jgi:hypothetical protein